MGLSLTTNRELGMSDGELAEQQAPFSFGEADDWLASLSDEIENMEPEHVVGEIHRIVSSMDSQEIHLGGLLHKAKQEKLWKGSYDSLADFFSKEFGIEYRKAMYMIAIYRDLTSSGVPWSTVSGIGWSKLKEISGILNQGNAVEIVGIVEPLTIHQTRAWVQAYGQVQEDEKDGGGEEAKTPPSDVEVQDISHFSLNLFKDQKEMVYKALDQAKDQLGSKDLPSALDAVCQSYLAGGDHVAAGDVQDVSATDALKSAIRQVDDPETVLGVFCEMYPQIDVTAEYSGEGAGAD